MLTGLRILWVLDVTVLCNVSQEKWVGNTMSEWSRICLVPITTSGDEFCVDELQRFFVGARTQGKTTTYARTYESIAKAVLGIITPTQSISYAILCHVIGPSLRDFGCP